MLDLGTLKIGIEVDDKQAKQGLNSISGEMDKTGQKTEGLGTKVKSLIKAFAAAYAVRELVKIGKAALDAYSQYEQLSGGIEKLFGEKSSKTVMKFAENAYKTAGVSANKYMELTTSFSASLLQSLGGDTEKAAKVADRAIKDMSDNANVFGSSMTDVQNAYKGFAKQNYTMLDNLKLGYGGTKTEMERLLADAEKLTGIHYDIANFDDVIEAIHIIQQEQHITGTTAKEASKTIEGSINMAKASWENFLSALGSGNGKQISKTFNQLFSSIGTVAKNVIPTLMNIVDGLLSSVFDAVPKLISGKGGGIVGQILAWVSTLPAKLMQGVTKMFNGLADNLSKLGNKGFSKAGSNIVKTIVDGVIKNAPALVKAAGRLAIELIKAIPKLLVGAGKAIVGAIVKGIKNSAGGDAIAAGKAVIDGIINGIKNAISGAINAVKGFFSGIFNAIGGFISNHPALKKSLSVVGNSFKKIAKPLGVAQLAFEKVRGAWNAVMKLKGKKKFSAIQDKIKDTTNKAKDLFKQWKSNLAQKASKTFSAIKHGFETFVSSAKKVQNRWKDVLGQTASKTFSVIKNGFSSFIESAKTILSKWKDILAQKASKVFDITTNKTTNETVHHHRTGLREVPYDGYLASLHRGETILTAAGTNQYKKWLQEQDKAKKEKTISSNRRVPLVIDYDKLAKTLFEALADVEMVNTIQVDGRKIAESTGPYMKNVIEDIAKKQQRRLGYV